MGSPLSVFLILLELQSYICENMAKQMLQYLGEVCKLNFSKYWGQSYDNTANMSGCYKGMHQKF